MPRAFITGITGQDGQHLAEFLHGKGYEVFGMVKGQNNPKFTSMRDEFPYVEPVPGDLADLPSLVKALELTQPDEVYNLGAISFVALSFNQAELTANITGLGVLRMLEAVRMVGGAQNNPIRFYQASSSEMFGKVREIPQNERTPFHPRSPYGCAKVFGHDITVNYRESYDLFACSGILFNHEGPRRGLEFVTRKVTNAVARIKLGLQEELVLGNLDFKRDWGYAGDYVKAMWLMLQQDEPDDYVVATGETHSGEELVSLAFAEAGIDDWQRYVRQDQKFFRPAEVDLLIGDPTKAQDKLGWQREVDFPDTREDDGRQRPAHRVRQALTTSHAELKFRVHAGRHEELKFGSRVRRWSALERHVDDGFHHRLVRRRRRRHAAWRAARSRTTTIAANDDATRPNSMRRNRSSLLSHVTSTKVDHAQAPAERDQRVALERDDGLGHGQGRHVGGAAEGEHRHGAAAERGVVHLLDDERAEQLRADDAGDADDDDDHHQLAEAGAELGDLVAGGEPGQPGQQRGLHGLEEEQRDARQQHAVAELGDELLLIVGLEQVGGHRAGVHQAGGEHRAERAASRGWG